MVSITSLNVFDQIAQMYNSMSPVEQKISNYLLQHKTDIQTMTISALASACEVGSASLTRYAHTLGYQSFSVFRTKCYADTVQNLSSGYSMDAALDKYREVYEDDPIETKCEKLYNICLDALQQTAKGIDPRTIHEAVNLLWNARSVYCFGQGNSSAVAFDAYTRFVPITNKFHWVADSHLQADTAALLEEGEVVLYFSFSGCTRELIENAKLVCQTRGKLILVTHFPNAPATEYADVVLLCGVNESPENQGSVAAKIGQLMIIDLLFNEYCSQDAEKITRQKKKTLTATDEKRIKRSKN